jgi:hypothetical protein
MKDDLPLVHALIDAFLLLESSGPDEVNADTAVRGMENMTSSLLALDHSDQLDLRATLEHIAENAREQAYKDFVRALPDMIGLAPQ